MRYKQQELRIIDFSRYVARKSPQRILSSAGTTALNRRDIIAADHSFPLPKILVMKPQQRKYLGIHVEHVLKIATVSLDQIHALPKIMEKQKQISALWGLACVEEKLVMLIDLTQLG